MGWTNDLAYELGDQDGHTHEGYVVALIEREGTSYGSGIYRELSYPTDEQDRPRIDRIQAGCDCGWRSSYMRPAATWWSETGKLERPRWAPFIAIVSDEDEERCRLLWRDHLDHELARRKVA